MKKLYSPKQVSVGAFLGGPIAAVYFLKKNFDALGKINEARSTLLYGTLMTIGMIFVLPFLPEKFPNMALPVVYTAWANLVVQQYQLKKSDIEASNEYTFGSNWKVLAVSIASLALFFVLAIPVFIGLEKAGYINLAD